MFIRLDYGREEKANFVRDRIKNEDPRYVFGDIHGQYDKLTHLISQLEEPRPIIFIGDLIDRGPKSFQIVELVRELVLKGEAICIRGNHEQMLLEAIDMAEIIDFHRIHHEALFIKNGGIETIRSYIEAGYTDMFPESHLEFFRELPLTFETQSCFFAHAGVCPEIGLQYQIEEDLLWIRKDFYNNDTPLEKVVIFGHTPWVKPLIEKDKIGIDTGAAYESKGHTLTVMRIPELDFMSA